MGRPTLRKLSTPLLLAPYAILFFVFIVIPVVAAIGLSFTYFNTMNVPKFLFLDNYIKLFTNDSVFMQKVLPNTIIYAVFVGGGGYVLSFCLAWSLSQVTQRARTIMAIIIYSPSMTAGVLVTTVWSVIFNGDKSGYLNALLLKLHLIEQPIQWLQSSDFLLTIMIIVSLWSSMGVGFLAILAGILNIDKEQYEAGCIDGITNRFQEILYIHPQRQTSNAVRRGDGHCQHLQQQRRGGGPFRNQSNAQLCRPVDRDAHRGLRVPPL